LYDDIERRRGALTGRTTEKFWDVRRRRRRVLLYLGELALDLGEDELREGAGATLLVDADVDSSILCDYRVCTQPVFVVELARKFGVCRWRLVGVC
jgi:hypothetical protein